MPPVVLIAQNQGQHTHVQMLLTIALMTLFRQQIQKTQSRSRTQREKHDDSCHNTRR